MARHDVLSSISILLLTVIRLIKVFPCYRREVTSSEADPKGGLALGLGLPVLSNLLV